MTTAARLPQDTDWDEEQRAVIEAPLTSRLLIDAGPGTGKTAVACARTAWLINKGVEPANIWFMSFTRTAVAEIRERIRFLADDEARAVAVRITTLDSQAWHLRAGFDTEDEDELFGGYDENIESVIALLRSGDPDVADYFEGLEHLIIDEAQDLVGIRAELVETMIELLTDRCGISVFTDDAQAIYGFSADDAPSGNPMGTGTFTSRVREGSRNGFSSLALKTIHRTRSESLHDIFVWTRQIVLDEDTPPRERLAKVVRQVRRAADQQVGDVQAQELEGRNDVLVLFRRRVEVLTASSFLRGEGIQHRLRMSGLPQVLQPWIGVLFWDATDPYMTQDQFLQRWENRISRDAFPAVDFVAAWEAVFALAGDRAGRLELRRLRGRLSRSRPPVQVVRPEVGCSGPILGTIHASKGREAPDVRLMMPKILSGDDQEEECRVIFVGATRPRETLGVGDGYRLSGSRSLGSGRAYRLNRPQRAQVEIGRDGDVSARLQVSPLLYPDRDKAVSVQNLLTRCVGQDRSVKLIANRDAEFRYEICLPDDTSQIPVGAMDKQLKREMWSVGEKVSGGQRLRPGDTVHHCHLIGVSSVVLAEDDPWTHELHPPFDQTGTFLVPVVTGFPTVFFPRY